MSSNKLLQTVLAVCLSLILLTHQACQHPTFTPTSYPTPMKPKTAPPETATFTPEPTRPPTSLPVTWNYVAFGDTSIISNAGPSSYATHYASFISEDLDVHVETAFYTIEDVMVKDHLDRLRNDLTLRNAISKAQVITIAIGDIDIIYPIIGAYLWESCGGEDNEDCIREALSDFRLRYNLLLDEILNLCSSGAIIRTMTLYTKSLHEIYGSDEDLAPFYKRLNDHIIDASQAHGIPVVQVHEMLEDVKASVADGYLNPAGWNPTEFGAQTIAELHRDLGYDPTCP